MKRILAALVLCVLCFSAACLAEETPQTFEWDGMKARIVGLSENTALSAALNLAHRAKGGVDDDGSVVRNLQLFKLMHQCRSGSHRTVLRSGY